MEGGKEDLNNKQYLGVYGSDSSYIKKEEEKSNELCNILENSTLKDIFNETVIGILNDYADLIKDGLKHIYHHAEQHESWKFALLSMYCIIDCDMETSHNILDPYSIREKKFIKNTIARCEIFHSQDFNTIKNDEPFKSILNGKICRLPNEENEIKEIIEVSRKIMLPRLKTIFQEIDPNGIKLKLAKEKYLDTKINKTKCQLI